MGDILVVGRRPVSDFVLFAWSLSEYTGYEPHPYLSEGGGGDPPPPEVTYSFYGQCASDEALARALSDKVAALPDSNTLEYSATIVGAGAGQFRVYRDSLFTLGNDADVGIHLPSDNLSAVKIAFHSHPVNSTSITTSVDLENRYPSIYDWNAFTKLITNSNVPQFGVLSSIKLAIRDPLGQVRIFAYADKDTYLALSRADRENGVGLPSALPGAVGCVGL